MRKWERNKTEPVNYEVFVLEKAQREEEKRKKEEKWEDMRRAADDAGNVEKHFSILRDICKEFGMVDVTSMEKEEPSQVELIRQFADGV